MEIWKDVKGYDGWYQISNHGQVRTWRSQSVSNDKRTEPYIMSPETVNKGYQRVSLSGINGNKNHEYIHRLVGKAFIPNPKNKPQINHKNGIKDDNMVKNLEWATRSENDKHAFEIGLRKPMIGENNPRAFLTENDVLNIRNAYNIGCFTQKEIAESYQVSRRSIGNIINRKSWTHI